MSSYLDASWFKLTPLAATVLSWSEDAARRWWGWWLASSELPLPLPARPESPADPWAAVPAVLARIVPPVFPSRDYWVTDFGARGDGKTDDSLAFRAAIAACAAAGGGRVLVPPGVFLTGPLHLLSGVNLRILAAATVRFSTREADYLPAVATRWEGVECRNYSPFIYAFDQENVAVTGEGTLDGQAAAGRWWHWKGPWEGETATGWRPGLPDQCAARARLLALAEAGVPVAERAFGEGDFLRPSFIQLYRCRNVRIEGVTIVNSPMWCIHPVLCRNVTVRGVTVRSHGPNNDGCVPESCSDVLIEDCVFDTGDDCIAIKSGRDADGRRVGVPSRDIVIQHCAMRDGHGGIVIGSEISGHVFGVFAEGCRMDSRRLERALRIKSNTRRGGVVEDVHLRDIEVGEVAQAAIDIDLSYDGERGVNPPELRRITVSRLTCATAQRALCLNGLPEQPIEGLRLVDCVFRAVRQPEFLRYVGSLALVRTVLPAPAPAGEPVEVAEAPVTTPTEDGAK